MSFCANKKHRNKAYKEKLHNQANYEAKIRLGILCVRCGFGREYHHLLLGKACQKFQMQR